MLSRRISIRLGAALVGCLCAIATVQAQSQTRQPARQPVRTQAPRQNSGRSGGTPARSVSASRAGQAAPNVAPIAVSPELEKLLAAWHDSSSLIKRLEGKHIRRIYDMVFRIEKRSVGQFFYESPDRGRIDINGYTLKKGEVSERIHKPDGKPYKLQSENPEQWVCDGKRIISVNKSEKLAEIFEIPEQARGANIMNGPLPFLFGMPPEMAKQRYNLQLITQSSKSIQLKAIPRWKQDQVNWQEAKIILDRGSFLPLHIQLKDPTGNTVTVYSFGNMIVNKKTRSVIFAKDPFNPSLRGYKVTSHTEDSMKRDLEQRQKEGQQLRQEVTGSTKPVKPVMPDVRGYPWKDAKQRLEQSGLTVKILKGPAAKRAKDVYHVVSQIPAARTSFPSDKIVRLTVYTMPQTAAGAAPATR